MAVTTSGVQNIFKIPELKRRILFTLAFLAIYRVGVHIPTPQVLTAQGNVSRFRPDRNGLRS